MNAHSHQSVGPTAAPLGVRVEHIQLVPVVPAGDYTLLIKGNDYIRRGRDNAMLRLALNIELGALTFHAVVVDLQLEHPDESICRRDIEDYTALLFSLGSPDVTLAEQVVGYTFRATVGKRQASASHRRANYFHEFHDGMNPPEAIVPRGVEVVEGSERQRDGRGRFVCRDA